MLKRSHIRILLVALATIIVILLIYISMLSSTYGLQFNSSVNQLTLPLKRNGNLYTFTGDIQYGVCTVKRNNIVIEGNGHKSGPIKLDHVNNVTIKNLNIESGRWTIYLGHSSNNKIINTTHNNHPISLYYSHNNIISQNTNIAVWLTASNNNTVKNNEINRIELDRSSNNLIIENTETPERWFTWLQIKASTDNLIFRNQINNNCNRWIALFGTSTNNIFVGNEVTGPFPSEPYFNAKDNIFYHNNFINAVEPTRPTTFENNQTNMWDNGKEGNYWNIYQGMDTNQDRIGDTPQPINPYNQDNHPMINPINLEEEPQPQLTPYKTETTQIPTTNLAAIIILSALILGVSVYKRKTITQTLNKIDKKTYTLAATFSIIGGIALIASTLYGFGTYLTYSSRGGWTTSGQIQRLSLIFLATLAISLIPTGLGYRKLAKTHQDPTPSYKFLPVIITSILLAITAGFLTTANPIHIQGNPGSYWNPCFFEDLDNRITFTQLTFTTFIMLGITQILWGRTQQKSQSNTEHPKLNKIVGKIQTFIGIISLTYTTFFFIMPMITWLFNPLAISLLFLLIQTLSATTFLYSKNTEPQKSQ